MLAAGSTVGTYVVERELGRGGMGVVLLARDSRLNRSVALKGLPEEFRHDAARSERLSREARALASMTHANIASVYGLEEFEGRTFVVMEYVAGESLDAVLERGPIRVAEVIEIARQIAAGLDAAHQAGIVHRDLKPANIMLTPDGHVKILDFGLAKDVAGSFQSGISNLVTAVSPSPTIPGQIMGTPSYLSPEQARGRAVDKRTDLWAFGCVIFECLTGTRAFVGESFPDTMAAIIDRAPDWSKLPSRTPPRLVTLLQRLLEKDVRARWRDVGDAAVELELAASELKSGSMTMTTMMPVAASKPRRAIAGVVLTIGVLAVGAGVAAGMWFGRGRGGNESAGAVRFVIEPPALNDTEDAARMDTAAVSPDGRTIVMPGTTGESVMLYARSLDSLELTAIKGTEGGLLPFFSPDGAWVAFHSGNEIRRVPLKGGSPQKICDYGDEVRGLRWSEQGYLYYTDMSSGGTLMRVAVDGGKPEQIGTPPEGEFGVRWPWPLPGGRGTMCVTFDGGDYSNSKVMVARPGEPLKVLMENAFHPQYAEPGLLLFGRGESVWAQRFDARTLTLSGKAMPVLDDAMIDPWLFGFVGARVADNGTLVYVKGKQFTGMFEAAWLDMTGKIQPTGVFNFDLGQFSADGTMLYGTQFTKRRTVVSADLERGTTVNLLSKGRNWFVGLMPGGQSLVYYGNRYPKMGLSVLPLNSAAEPQVLAEGAKADGGAISPDGKWLIAAAPNGYLVMHQYDLSVSPPTMQSISFPHRFANPKFSPDGKWVSYVSDGSGAMQVYIRAFPFAGPPVQVTTRGGTSSNWSHDGTTLYYMKDASVYSCPIAVTAGSRVTVGASTLVANGEGSDILPGADFLPGPDEKRFLVSLRHKRPAGSEPKVVVETGWAQRVWAELGAQ